MKKLLEFIPAFFCFLYFEGAAYLVASVDDPPVDLALQVSILAAPILSFLIVTIFFWRWSTFGQRFTCFVRSMLVVLTTAGVISVLESIAFCISSNQGLPIPPFYMVIFVIESSLFWLPFTIVCTAAYCFPLWIWEGRDNPSHLSRRLGRAIFRLRSQILEILAIGVVLLGWNLWRQTSANPLWVYVAPKNVPFHLTTGLAPDGTDVVIAHTVNSNDRQAGSYLAYMDARNGHVCWERSAGSAYSAIIDPDGNVIYAGGNAFVTKLSGADGKLLWQQRVMEANDLAAGLFSPVADSMGQIWISGIKGTWSNHASRFLALLDSGNGKVRWQKTQAPEDISAIYPPRIFPLKDGDAFSVLPPSRDGFPGKHEWTIQRLSGKNGNVQWEVAEPSVRNDIENVHWLVDEPHCQVVIFSGIKLVVHDLLTGKEKWHVDSPAPIPGLVVNMSFDNQGNLVFWSTNGGYHSLFSYWYEFSPLPFFESTSDYSYHALSGNRNLRITVSIINGRILDCQEFGGAHEKLYSVLTYLGTGPPSALILQTGKSNHNREPWRVIMLNHGTLPALGGLPLFARQPRGSDLRSTFNGSTAITRSGKFVNCDFNSCWQIQAW